MSQQSTLAPAMDRLVDALADQFVADYLADPVGFMTAVDAGVHYERQDPERKTCVYRHFNDGGQLLYVGSSVSPKNRRHGHRSASHWYPQSIRMTEEWFDTRREALDAELLAIKTENPIHNLQGKPGQKPR